jgi:glucuronokinase
MRLLRRRAHARAGLVGNPSDGYHGKTISLIVRNFWAEVVLYEWEDLELVWTDQNQNRFSSIEDLVRDVKMHGYFGGIPLLKATIKRFRDYCRAQNHALHERNFSLRYETNIPRQVGLAGSSAIIIATLRCLMDFYGVEIPKRVQPSLALAVETEELGITAGLQDRVIQVHEGLAYMDFARERMEEVCGYRCGVYEPLDPALLPPVYLAYTQRDTAEITQPTYVVHTPIKVRYQQGEPKVVQAMVDFADLAAQAREAILGRDAKRLAGLIDRNFDIRRSIYAQMLQGQIDMVETARAAGASAQFAGSGGAIIGTYRDEAMFRDLQQRLGGLGCCVIKPQIMENRPGVNG